MLPGLFKSKEGSGKPSSPIAVPVQPPAPSPSAESTRPSRSLPFGFRWLVLAQMVGAFFALVLQLAGASVHVLAVVHVAVPLLFLTAAVCSMVVLGSPGPYSALVSALTGTLASITAVTFLVVAVQTPHSQSSAGRNVQDALFAVYLLICLSEGIICLIVASIAYRYSQKTDKTYVPVVFRFGSPSPDGNGCYQLVNEQLHSKPNCLTDEQRHVVQLGEDKTKANAVANHSEC